MVMPTYTVTASRGAGHQWVFKCQEFPRAQARGRSLADAYELMPDELAFVAGVDPASVEIDVVPDCAVVPIDDAQVALPELVAETALHEVYLTQSHEAVAVLVSADRYERTLRRVKELEESLDAARRVNGFGERRSLTAAVRKP
jgi:hypothetical protein